MAFFKNVAARDVLGFFYGALHLGLGPGSHVCDEPEAGAGLLLFPSGAVVALVVVRMAARRPVLALSCPGGPGVSASVDLACRPRRWGHAL